MTLRSLFRYIHERDVTAFQQEARRHAPLLDKTLPPLTHAANRSMLWLACAGLLWLFGGRFGRRAALRGLMSVAMSSAVANGPAKLLTRRPRPGMDDIPLVRRVRKAPRSSSFPSGHSASAFAFATGAAMELPALAVPLGPLAAAVAYSRVYTGAHYPSDVIAGAALGSSIALSTGVFWPVAPSEAREAGRAQRASVDPYPNGERVTIVVNNSAGSSGSGLAEDLKAELPDARVDEIEIENGKDLKDALEAAAGSSSVVGVSGGDGSINCAAQVALDHDVPLLVIPGGTLNHLARDVGIDDISSSLKALKAGDAIAMDVATIDDQVFLNTASFGAYAELVDAREKLEDRIGKWPALAIALVRVLRRGKPTEVEIDGEARKIWMIFIGNCRYHPSGFAPAWRDRLDDGKLDVRLVDATAPFGRFRLIASVLTGRLGRSRVYEQKLVDQLKVRSLQGELRLARDGETFSGSAEFTIEKRAGALRIYAPIKD